MTPPTVRARVWCEACRRYEAWFPAREDRATVELAAAHARHRTGCAAAKGAAT
jgi:hypothetical protein